MSKRHGPAARAHPMADERRGGASGPSSSGPSSSSVPGSSSRAAAELSANPRYSRSEYAKVLALQEEVARADSDYQRLRSAYLDLVENEPTHEVALGMIGADMDRCHGRLQALIGLPRLPFTHEPSTVMRREAQRLASEKG